MMHNPLNHIVVVGAGNVGTHLAELFKAVAPRVTLHSHLADDLPREADLFLLCITDSALENVAESLTIHRGVVAHTSGTMPLHVLKRFPSHGIFYPFQTFRREVPLINKDFPILIEASESSCEQQLIKAASLISSQVMLSDEAGRRQLHVAGVFASNFTNLMYSAAWEVANTRFDARKVLTPLLRETLERIGSGVPEQFQTGPAVRNDLNVIASHLEWLRSKPELKQLYEELTRAIQKKYGHEPIS